MLRSHLEGLISSLSSRDGLLAHAWRVRWFQWAHGSNTSKARSSRRKVPSDARVTVRTEAADRVDELFCFEPERTKRSIGESPSIS